MPKWLEDCKDNLLAESDFYPKRKDRESLAYAVCQKQHKEDKAIHAKDKCMRCDEPPTIAVIWADGRGRAWFCDKHFAQWKSEEDREIVKEIKVSDGIITEETKAIYSHTFAESRIQDILTEHCICPDCGEQIKKKQNILCQETGCPDCNKPMVAKEYRAYRSFPMRIAKATIRDGAMYWQGVISDDEWDAEDERLALSIFDDFKYRLDAERQKADYEPPFLSLSHYKRMEDGSGERGTIEDIWTQGKAFKAEGWFKDDPLSKRCFEVVRDELEHIKAGEEIEGPVRFSIGFYPEKTAIEEGRTVYLKGILDHVALTRVPINPRTGFTHVTEKSMKTRKDDALSIVGDEFTDEIDKLDEKQRAEKADLDDMVTKAELTPNEEQDLLLVTALQKADYDDEAIEKATWDYAYKKALPNSAYAWVESGPGCEKKDGETPQKCRHLPYKDKGGGVDCGHVRAALQAIGGARTGKKMKAPASAKAKLTRALKSCQSKAAKAEVLEDEYEQGRIDGYNAALDMIVSDDVSDKEVNIMADETKDKEAKSQIDFDAIKKAIEPEDKPAEEPKVESPFDKHVDLLKQVITAEGHGRTEKLEAAEALLRSLAAHISSAINESTPASPEDVAESLKAQVQEVVKPLQDEIALLKQIVTQGVAPSGTPESRALKGVGFHISPEESLRAVREKAGAGGDKETNPLRQMVNESVGLSADHKRSSPL